MNARLMLAVSAVLARVQEDPGHDRLDGSMFWAGLFMVGTPLLIGASVAGYIWWTRRQRRAANGNTPSQD